jgi:alanine racemase
MQKTLCVVDLEIIKNNAAYVKKLIGDRFFYAVVKADGYGHGGVEVANALSQIADGFCVAIIDEGVALRVAGVIAPILVFAPPLDSFDVARAREYGLTLTVNSESCARLLDGVDCEIKINTGMNRIGCAPKDTLKVLKCLKKSRVVGAYSHLFSPENDVVSTRQYDLFCGALKYVLREFPDARVHLSASGGILRGGKYLFNCVRAYCCTDTRLRGLSAQGLNLQ